MKKTESLLEQISSLEGELNAKRDAAEKLPVLQEEMEVINQSYADLKKCMEELEMSHSSSLEDKSTLEKSLTEKTSQVVTLDSEVRELKGKMIQESENHSLEMETLLEKEKHLRGKLDAAKQSAAAAKAESSSRRDEIKSMKATLSAASRGLEERDDTIKGLKEKLNRAEVEQTKTSELLKEKVVAMNKIKVGLLINPPSMSVFSRLLNESI